ncbi:PaaI family thioesterase [Cryptosporangium sp. NPDC051539]|uniref:PaaI family thioesterase n=1 Tax=Cryptosporangium sp. NPDC051539 TaxID=3363962 RepID=UPI0037983F01
MSPEEERVHHEWFEEHWRKHVPFNVDIGLDILDWEPGFVRAQLPYQARLSAHDGIFHGGVLASALDTIGSGAVVAGHDFNLGSRFTTVSMTINYMSVARNQDVFVEGVCAKRGRRLSFARASVLAPDGSPLAEAVLTVSTAGTRPRVGEPEGH